MSDHDAQTPFPICLKFWVSGFFLMFYGNLLKLVLIKLVNQDATFLQYHKK